MLAVTVPSVGGPRAARSGEAVLLVDDDGGQPMFAIQGMTPGVPIERCMTVTNAGTRPVGARLFAHARRRLRGVLEVRVTRGTLPSSAAFPSCDGFTPDATVDVGHGPGVVFVGTIARLSGRYATAGADPGSWLPGVARAYRFTVTLTTAAARRHLRTRVGFLWRASGAAR